MVTYVTRAQIGLRKANGSNSLVPSQVKNTAFHYPGTAKPINAVGQAGFERVCSALRGWQAYHMDTKGWSDIAYQVAVDQVGRAYTLRGINIRSAANGGTQVNLEYGAVLLVLGNNEEPSAAMAAAARGVMGDYRIRFARIPRRPTWHGAIRPGGTASDPSTDCPGKLTIAQIKAGKFDASSTPVQPPATPKPPVPEDDMVTPNDVVGTDIDGSPMTMAELAARTNFNYRAILEGGKVDSALDDINTKLDRLTTAVAALAPKD